MSSFSFDIETYRYAVYDTFEGIEANNIINAWQWMQPQSEDLEISGLTTCLYLFQDFTLDMYFRQFWKDDRLKFDRGSTGLEKLVVGAEYINLIWTPDTFFVNEKSAYFHEATTENQFLRILHDGNVLRSIR